MGQAMPWDSDPIVGAAPAVTPGARVVQIVPPQPDQPPAQTPTQAELTAEQLRAARLENDRREATARQREAGRPLPPAIYGPYSAQVGIYSQLASSADTFQPDFAGNTLTGGMENTAQRLVNGVGTPGQAQWWAHFQQADNQIRNALFGSALTPTEQRAYESTTITPSMDPAQIRENLRIRRETVRAALARQTAFLRAQGYNEEALGALGGTYAADFGSPDAPAQTGQPPADPNAAPPGTVAVESDAAPASAVTAEGRQLADQAMALFRGGASREQMDEFARMHGRQPFGPDLDQAIAARNAGRGNVAFAPPETLTPAGERAAALDETQGEMDAGDLALHGAMGSLGDEAAGVAGFIRNAIEAPFSSSVDFDPAGAYQLERDADRIRQTGAREESPYLGTAAEIAGSFASANPTAAIEAVAPRLLARIGAGAKPGAVIGAEQGFGQGEGTSSSLFGIPAGAITGATIGALIPAAGAAARAAGRGARGVYRTVMGDNPNLAQRLIVNAGEADGNTAASVGANMAEAHADGVPAMLADSGDNARGLLAASARAPGPSRTMARDALDERQAGMADRIARTIERDLGPVANPHQIADDLMTRAHVSAAPLYDAAYSRPGAATFARGIQPLLQRPGMQRALSNARRIAAEEGRNPDEIGLVMGTAEPGSVLAGETAPIVVRNPTWQTLDYVKRGMDDVVETYRDSTTGRLNLNTEGRAINNTLRSYISAFDRANPDYAAARAAYGGPVRALDAFSNGRQALSMNADDLEARMRDLTDFDREMFRAGTRRAMAELVATKGDTANVVHALVGTGKKRAMLGRLFGDRQGFERFARTLGHEQEAFRTFSTARLGSPTAANLQDDAALQGATAAVDMVLTGMPWRTAIAQAFRFGAGKAGSKAQQQVTALLRETNPARFRELADELRREQTRRAVQARRSNNIARGAGVAGGEIAGSAQRP